MQNKPKSTAKAAPPSTAPALANVRGRNVLLAHAFAQREMRMAEERRQARTEMAKRSSDGDKQIKGGDGSGGKPAVAANAKQPTAAKRAPGKTTRQELIAEAMRLRKQTPPTASSKPPEDAFDRMISGALGSGAADHMEAGKLDRQAALQALIEQEQARLNRAGTSGDTPTKVPAPDLPPRTVERIPAATARGEVSRDDLIAEALDVHRRKQTALDELTDAQRATLRMAAEKLLKTKAG